MKTYLHEVALKREAQAKIDHEHVRVYAWLTRRQLYLEPVTGDPTTLPGHPLDAYTESGSDGGEMRPVSILFGDIIDIQPA